MEAKNIVVYVPPVYEEVQHEVTSVDDKNNPLRTSFHTDVSLLQRFDIRLLVFRCSPLLLCCLRMNIRLPEIFRLSDLSLPPPLS